VNRRGFLAGLFAPVAMKPKAKHSVGSIPVQINVDSRAIADAVARVIERKQGLFRVSDALRGVSA